MRRRDERGTASVFVVGLIVVLLACAGLVVDGGNALNARMKLADDLENAARAGAQMIDLVDLRQRDVLTIDEGAARQRAHQHLAGLGYQNIAVAADGDSVTVSAEDTVDTVLLSLIGIGTFHVSATATATAEIP